MKYLAVLLLLLTGCISSQGATVTRPDVITVEVGNQNWQGENMPYASASATWYLEYEE